MIAEKLRKSILQAAIQGKLTEQLPEDSDARELLVEIKAEKARLVKDGKIKKEKPLPEITEEEIPFDIPDNWCLVRLGDVVINRDAERKPVSKIEREGRRKEYDYYGASGVIDKIDGYLFSEELLLIGEDGANLINRSTPIAFIARGKYWVNNHAHVLQMTKGIIIEYLCCYVNAISLAQYVTGTAQPKMNQQKMNSIIVSIPPIKEQEKIVERLKTIFSEIEKLEKDELKLQLLQKSFSKKMKDSLLQAAIQGKLTAQLETDGDARALVADIQKEKARLVKEGKIKKEKPLPEITEDEIPFDIPESWKWVRFSELMNTMSTGPFGSMLHKSDYVTSGTPLVNPANISNGKIIPSDKMMVSISTKNRLESYVLHTGMIVMGRRGEMGRCAVVTDSEDGWLCGTGSFFMKPSSFLNVDFINTIFSTPYAKTYLGGESVGTTMSNLNHKILSKMLVPVPPLAEQQRIVAKLEEILPLCGKLK